MCSLKYLPTHLLKDCNFVLLLMRVFTINHDVGITRTLKTQNHFHAQKQPFGKRLNKKFMSYFTIKTIRFTCISQQNKTKN